MTGGRYFRARDTAEFAEIYKIFDELEPAESDERGFRPITELFHWPLGAAVVVALAAALVGLRRGALAVVARARSGSRERGLGAWLSSISCGRFGCCCCPSARG